MVPTIEEEEEDRGGACKSGKKLQFQLQFQQVESLQRERLNRNRETSDKEAEIEVKKQDEKKGEEGEGADLIKINETTVTTKNDKTSDKKNKLLERASSFAFSIKSPDKLTEPGINQHLGSTSRNSTGGGSSNHSSLNNSNIKDNISHHYQFYSNRPIKNQSNKDPQSPYKNSPSLSSNYISSLVNKSSILLSSLRQSYNSLTTTTITTTTNTKAATTMPMTPMMHQSQSTPQPQPQPPPEQAARQTNERNAATRASAPEQVPEKRDSTSSGKLIELEDGKTTVKVTNNKMEEKTNSSSLNQQQSLGVQSPHSPTRTGGDNSQTNNNLNNDSANKPPKPPLPPPPPREVVQAAIGTGNSSPSAASSPRLTSNVNSTAATTTTTLPYHHLQTTASATAPDQRQKLATTSGNVSQQLSSQQHQSGLPGSTNCNTQAGSTQIITTQVKTQPTLSITQSLGLYTTTTTTTTTPVAAATSFATTDSTTPTTFVSGGLAGSRRHALQEQSLERDAALSLKVKDLKHKRTSSIKSALRHAHLGPLRSFNLDKRTSSSSAAASSSSSSNSNNNQSGGKPVKSMPYELFEPPITQRTFQRTKRRGAMMSDPRRQMSADTIGLRQLTDEYLHNAGVKPMSTSGQCSLVALAAQTNIQQGSTIAGCVNGVTTNSTGHTGGTIGVPSSSTTSSDPTSLLAMKRAPTIGTYSSSASMSTQQHIHSPQLSIETQLYQAGKHTLTSGSSRKSSGATICSQDSLSNVTILPGNLPWQSDVSIQCEILQAPPSVEPYETTGDILNTIAGPFRGTTLVHANSTSGSGPGSLDSDRGAHQLGATLKRGLTAISQHHLTPGSGPSSALNVVGSLKKSLSNTLDISHLANARTTAAVASHLHSQDSLPAYSSLLNEPDSDNDDRDSYRTGSNSNGNGITANQNNSYNQNNNHHSTATLDPESSGFIGQLTSKLTRQGSKKFSVSKKGLQRALSFDCRGYKRLEHNHQQNQSNESSSSVSARNLLSAANKRAHNKSTLALNVDLTPRPYLPQSASQVDFQIPLLPYHKMQEAIVSQRLLDPRAPDSGPKSVEEEIQLMRIPQHDADELLCTQTSRYTQDIVEPQRFTPGQQHQQYRQELQLELERDQSNSGNLTPGATTTTAVSAVSQQTAGNRRPPRLVLDIPTIATPNSDDTQLDHNNNNSSSTGQSFKGRSQNIQPDEEDGEEANANNHDESIGSTLVVCSPSNVNISLDPAFNALSNSPSFCIDQNNKSSIDSRDVNQLTASDVFSRSKIKRPSTMVVSDAMNQVAQALNSTTSSATANKQQEGVSSVLRNRRRAIVPPKLATDGSISDSDNRDGEARVGQLVDVDDNNDGGDNERSDENSHCDRDRAQLNLEDEAALRAFRRKRSGGGTEKSSGHQQQQQQPDEKIIRKLSGALEKRTYGSQSNLPTFNIEALDQPANNSGDVSSNRQTPDIGGSTTRPESQMTNFDSIVSSGSSTNLSLSGKKGDAASQSSLLAPFNPSKGRRRSSIAVIPQMQICPGDLLVYSKQLIDRMNKPETETEPPNFLTIDEKKGKNIWSSFKLCAQFDSRSLKARNEFLCGLEDVLAGLQPSTFVDEQLSHYKGMLWNEFLYETESRRSASSDGLALLSATLHEVNIGDYQTGQQEASDLSHLSTIKSTKHDLIESTKSCSILVKDVTGSDSHREPLKITMSTGGANFGSKATPIKTIGGGAAISSQTVANNETSGGGHRSRDPTCRSISSRFREKPKLKRGQTVDSVFRIPLIPSSPLKHAQQHQQTPTAHLEQDDLVTIEDDERSSPSASSRSPSQELTSLNRRNRSASTRSRSGSSNRATTVNESTNSQQLSTNEKHVAIRTSPSSPFASSSISTTISQKAAQYQQHQQANDSQDKDQDSSFETDDAMDLMMPDKQDNNNNNSNRHAQLGQVKSYNISSSGNNYDRSLTRTPHQIVRQSSLSTLSSTITRTEQKRQRALWDLFQSECTFFFDHLMTLKNVYMEPLKKIQVEGFAMFADPDVLFGNLDELCCGVYDFCKEFLYIIMRTLKTRPEELNATDVLIKLYKKNPKIDHLRGVYHRYTLNYINALTYLESLRRQVEFVEFEKWSSRDVRCKKLQLTDLLVAPVQHIMRVPIILKDIESHTENPRDREEIMTILAVEEASLRELDDKMRWLKNFERLLEIQKNISWPSILELDPKLFIPEFLKDVLSKQPCEKLIVSPRRQIVHEGTLSNMDLGRACDMHVILFDDMLLLTRRKKGLTKRTSTVCKTNSGGPSQKDDGSYKYIVYKQPLSLDRFYVHDVQQLDSHSKYPQQDRLFILLMNRFQQIINVHSFSAPNDDVKQTWLFKIKKTVERWKKNLSDENKEEQSKNKSASEQSKSASTTVPAIKEPASGQNDPVLQLNRSSSVKQQVSRVDRPATTTSSD